MGVARFTINLSPNNYLINYWISDNNYQTNVYSTIITVRPLKTVVIEPINRYVKKGDNLYVKLVDNTHKKLVNYKLSFLINGEYYNRTTNSNGEAGMRINFNEGTYSIDILYIADYNKNTQGYYLYESRNLTITIRVVDSGTNTYSFTSTSTVINYRSYFNFVLKNQNNQVLSNKKVYAYINGFQYERTTNSQGSASIQINLEANSLFGIGLSFGDGNGIGKFYKLIYVNYNNDMNTAQSNVNSTPFISYSSDYNCINDPNLISKANEITANCNDELEKIVAIHNYVFNTGYLLYGNGLFNASETLTMHRANCYDQTNLLMSLAKISNIPVRGVGGSSTTNNVGHMWLQTYINGLWIVSDPTNTLTFGNWDDTDKYLNRANYSYCLSKYKFAGYC